jgi:hypothetical protein
MPVLLVNNLNGDFRKAWECLLVSITFNKVVSKSVAKALL